MISLVDSHCHLDFDEFSGDLPAVLSRATEAGVKLVLTISTRMTTVAKTLSIADRFPNVYCAVGIHPHHAASEGAVTARQLADVATHPKVVAIGEAGLDYHYNFSPRDVQEKSFRTQIEAARQSGLPLIVHSREAEEATARIIEQEMEHGKFTPLLHCFSSSLELAHRGLAAGAYISFSGILTFKNGLSIVAAAEISPQDRLLVETDAPYLAPVPHRGRINEPAYVVHTLRKLAEIKKVDKEEMARIVNRNFFRLFAKVPVPRDFEETAR